jgi:membrane fusion protein (multidrug efflux system)
MTNSLPDGNKPSRRISGRAKFSASVIALSSLLLSAPSVFAQMAMPPAKVGVLTLQPQPVTIQSELSGRVTASAMAEVRPQVGGLIVARNFEEGSRVNTGDVLYEIDPASYQAAYDTAVAAETKAKANLKNAHAKLARVSNLNSQQVLSAQELENAELAYDQAAADMRSAEAQRDNAALDLKRTKVVAPISGLVGRSELLVGALVTAGQAAPLATIRNIDRINVDVTRSTSEYLELQKKIKSGEIRQEDGAANVTLTLDDGSQYPHAGRLEFSEVFVDEGTGTYSLRANFENPEGALLPGMFVRAKVDVGISEKSFLVPQRAVSRDPKGNATALFVGKDGIVEQRSFVANEVVGDNWVLHEGVSEGDRVIVEGSMKAQPGSAVEATEVTINAENGLTIQSASAAP